MKKNKLIIPAIVAMTAGLALFGGTYVHAQSTGSQSKYPSIVQKLVDKFGLKEADVQAVFDQDRSDQMAQMEAKFTEQLDKLVADGKLTEVQKQAILTKRQELQTEMKAQVGGALKTWDKGVKPTQAQLDAMKTQMEARKKALEDWAKQNGIDTQYLRLIGGFGGRGFGHDFDKGQGRPDIEVDDVNETPASNS